MADGATGDGRRARPLTSDRLLFLVFAPTVGLVSALGYTLNAGAVSYYIFFELVQESSRWAPYLVGVILTVGPPGTALGLAEV